MSRGVRTRRKPILLESGVHGPQLGNLGGGEPLPVWLGQTQAYAASTDTGLGGRLLAVRDWLETRYGTSTVTHLSIYCGTTVAGQVRLGLYADSSNAPGSKLAETAEFTPVSGWNTVPVTTPVNITPGTYWIAFACNNSTLQVGTQSSAGIGFTNGAREASSFSYGALPSSFGASGAFDSYHFSVYASLKATTLTKPADPPAPAVPSPIEGQGYSLVFQDEFDFYDRLKWGNLIWYDSPPFQSDLIYCQDSVMHLKSKKPPGWTSQHAYSLTNIGTLGRYDFEEGYFEARMRWPNVVGCWPAFWMLSRDWAYYGSCGINVASELDMMEAVGDEPTALYGTIHRDSSEACLSNITNGNNYQDGHGLTLAGNWVVYGMKWTPTLVSWYLNNNLIMSQAIGPSTSWTTFAGNPQQLLIWSWTHSLDGGWGTEVVGDVDPIDVEVDWVRVWQQ